MKSINPARIQRIGQRGFLIEAGEVTGLMDLCLSKSAQELESPDLSRPVETSCKQAELTGIDWVLFTHDHIDHCDPHTVPFLAKATANSTNPAEIKAIHAGEEWPFELILESSQVES